MAGPIRLTLRTLLAYLDDTLEPDQAKVIGQKIAESEVAHKLMERIKAATHNRQLPAPMVSGPGAKVDANVVAEYLDSVLEGDKLAELEEILLKSDVLLAEVAASHQILSMYLSQPGQVSAKTHERMYKLSKEGRAKPAGKPKPARALPPPLEDDEEDELEDEMDQEEDPDEDEDEDSELDDSSVGAPLKARRRAVPLLPILALLVIGAGLAYMVWHSLFTSMTPTSVASNTEPTDASKDGGATADTAKKATPTEKKETAVEKKKEEPPQVKKEVVEEKKKESPPEKEVVEEKKKEIVEEKKKESIDKLPDTKPSTERREAGRMLAPLPTLPAALVRRAGTAPWVRVKPDEKVQTMESLASLPGYRSKVQLAGGVELTLFGQLPEFSAQFDPMLESCVILHAPEPGIDADITLDHGRIILGNLNNRAAKVRLRLAGEIWDLTLADNQSVAGVELWGFYPPEVPFRPQPGASDGPLLLANVYSLKGQNELKIRYLSFALPTPSILQWNNRSGPPQGPQAMTQAPQWFTDAAPPASQVTRDVRAALDDLDGRLTKKSVDIALIEMRKETKPAPKLLAMRSLQGIDAIGELIAILADEKDAYARTQVIPLLRFWIGRNPDNEQTLFQMLSKKGYTPAQSEMIMELLHLFPREAWENPATYEKLIANLRHDKLAIRQLSHWHLLVMAPDGQKIPYDPTGSAAQVDEAIKQWKKLIPDGKLPPVPKK